MPLCSPCAGGSETATVGAGASATGATVWAVAAVSTAADAASTALSAPGSRAGRRSSRLFRSHLGSRSGDGRDRLGRNGLSDAGGTCHLDGRLLAGDSLLGCCFGHGLDCSPLGGRFRGLGRDRSLDAGLAGGSRHAAFLGGSWGDRFFGGGNRFFGGSDRCGRRRRCRPRWRRSDAHSPLDVDFLD